MSKWISGCYVDHAVENTFLVAQPMQLVCKSRGWCSDSGGHSKQRKPAGKDAKGSPPKGGHLGTLRHTEVPKRGVP